MRRLEFFLRLKERKIALVGMAIIALLILVAILAPFISPHDPVEQNLGQRLLGPGKQYPLGTDNLGRCVLSRIIYGARTSLSLGIIVVGVTTVGGTILGLIAGYRGGIVDQIIMRLVDIMFAFPAIILAIALAGVLGPGLSGILLAMVIVGWAGYARVVRGSVLSIKEKEYIEAARALGFSDQHIMVHHILPNVMAPIIVMATLSLAFIILMVAGLGFLGLGAQPPTPDWGKMLTEGRPFMRTAPQLTVFPGLAIMVTAMAFIFLSEGLREALNPRREVAR